MTALLGGEIQVLVVGLATVLPYVKAKSDKLKVVATMGAKKYGSAVVMQNGKVVGIFTTVDLCRAFTDLLQTRLTH